MIEEDFCMVLEDEEAKAFLEYARRESTPEEKEDLKRCLEFYKKHEPTPPMSTEII